MLAIVSGCFLPKAFILRPIVSKFDLLSFHEIFTLNKGSYNSIQPRKDIRMEIATPPHLSQREWRMALAAGTEYRMARLKTGRGIEEALFPRIVADNPLWGFCHDRNGEIKHELHCGDVTLGFRV